MEFVSPLFENLRPHGGYLTVQPFLFRQAFYVDEVVVVEIFDNGLGMGDDEDTETVVHIVPESLIDFKTHSGGHFVGESDFKLVDDDETFVIIIIHLLVDMGFQKSVDEPPRVGGGCHPREVSGYVVETGSPKGF